MISSQRIRKQTKDVRLRTRILGKDGGEFTGIDDLSVDLLGSSFGFDGFRPHPNRRPSDRSFREWSCFDRCGRRCHRPASAPMNIGQLLATSVAHDKTSVAGAPSPARRYRRLLEN